MKETKPAPLVLRADADASIGAGHFMRCLALAEAWGARGGDVAILTTTSNPSFSARARAAGVEPVPLASRHPDPADLRETLHFLGAFSGGEEAILCTDGYFFSPDYHRAVRSAGYSVMVIDDTGHLPWYDADLILNQNIGAKSLRYPCRNETTLLLGTEYVLLRAEFAASPPPRRGSDGCRILVTMGGSDPRNLTLRVARALRRLGRPELDVLVVAGAANPCREELRSAMAAWDGTAGSYRLHVDPPSMRDLMASADIAISAAGSTCWELAYLGVPSLLVVTADNQANIAAGLHAAGAAVSLGWFEELDDAKMAAQLGELLDRPELRRRLSAAAADLVDGRGAARVADAIARVPTQRAQT